MKVFMLVVFVCALMWALPYTGSLLALGLGVGGGALLGRAK